MTDRLDIALIAALCTGSLLAWGYALQRAVACGHSPFPADDAPRTPIPLRIAWMGMGCIAFFLIGPAVEWLSEESVAAAETSLLDVQVNCAFEFLLVGLLLGTFLSLRTPLAGLGFRFDQPLQRMWDAWLGFHLGIGPVFLVLIASELGGLRGDEPQHELLRMLTADGSWANWFWISLTAVVAAPLAEELLFRVVLQGWLEQVTHPAIAIGASSLLFCTVHRFPDSLALVPLAVVLGYVQHRRRSYLTVVAIHALFNGVNLLLTALSGNAP